MVGEMPQNARTRPAVPEAEYRTCANPLCPGRLGGHRFKVRKNRDTYCDYSCGRKHKAALQREAREARVAVAA